MPTYKGQNTVALVDGDTGVPYSLNAGIDFVNIASNATTTVKSGSGRLARIVVNKKGSSVSAAVVYDNTAGSGTKIATIDTLNLSGVFEYGITFDTGLTIVTTGAPDITVVYS